MTVIVDSGGANLNSILFALERLNMTAKVTKDKNEIEQADRVILPGVGAANDAMQRLTQLQLVDTIRKLKQPVLGICLGMQLLYESSNEGEVDCLGIIPGKVERLPKYENLTIPHMGWNSLTVLNDSPIVYGLNDGDYVYFVHSFCAPINENSCAVTNYGKTFTAIVESRNFYAVQFHPERSSEVGAQLLKNFLEL